MKAVLVTYIGGKGTPCRLSAIAAGQSGRQVMQQAVWSAWLPAPRMAPLHGCGPSPGEATACSAAPDTYKQRHFILLFMSTLLN